MKKKLEKRRAQRIEINADIKYRSISKNKGKWKKAICCDLSGIGCQLTLNENLPLGKKVSICFSDASFSKPIKLICQVVWCRIKPHCYRTGLKIIKIDDPIIFVEGITSKIIDLSMRNK